MRAGEETIIFKYRAAVPSDLIDSESVDLSDVCCLLWKAEFNLPKSADCTDI